MKAYEYKAGGIYYNPRLKEVWEITKDRNSIEWETSVGIVGKTSTYEQESIPATEKQIKKAFK